MTNPVILLGTQSNGETLPVQVDATGRLVAEGLQGEQGSQGEQGPPGPQGPAGELELPPDPYEGALLGWLNNELAWIGSPPVPIPPGVFGPITSWDPVNGVIGVEGEIPAEVGTGVYVWQCDAQGNYYTAGLEAAKVWSSAEFCTSGKNGNGIYNSALAFNNQEGSEELWYAPNGGPIARFETGDLFNDASVLEINYSRSGSGQFLLNGSPLALPAGDYKSYTHSLPDGFQSLEFDYPSGGNYCGLCWMKIDGKQLIDNSYSLNFRVNQTAPNMLIGVSNINVDFTIGKYLRIPQQRVAPWVLYGNDPTSLIDHLRRS